MITVRAFAWHLICALKTNKPKVMSKFFCQQMRNGLYARDTCSRTVRRILFVRIDSMVANMIFLVGANFYLETIFDVKTFLRRLNVNPSNILEERHTFNGS